jgi:hypothetical protein
MTPDVDWDAEEDYDGYLDDDDILRKMRDEFKYARKPHQEYPQYQDYSRGSRDELYDAPVRGGRGSFPPPPPDRFKRRGRRRQYDEDDEDEDVEKDLVDFGDLKKFLLGERPRDEDDEEALEALVLEEGPRQAPFFLRPFRPKVRSLFTMQIISSLALLTIYILNFYLNQEFFDKLAEVSRPIALVGNPWALTVLGAALGVGLVMFSYMASKPKKILGIVIASVAALVFLGPCLLALISTGWYGMVWQGWIMVQVGVKLILLFLVMSPLILGILGIWLESRLSLYVSTMLLLGIVIVLDVFLVIYNRTPAKQLWSIPLIIFACGLFIFFEFGDSAIRFNKLYQDSVHLDRKTVQSRHIVRMCQRYLVLSVVFLTVTMFLTLLIYNSNTVLLGGAGVLEYLPAVGPYFKDMPYLEKTSASLVMDTVYGSLISMGIVIFLLILFGTMVRNWYDISTWGKRRYRSVTTAYTSMKQREAEEEEFEEIIVRRQERKRKTRARDLGLKRPATKRRTPARRRSGSRRKKGKAEKLYKVKSVKIKTGKVKKKKPKKRKK